MSKSNSNDKRPTTEPIEVLKFHEAVDQISDLSSISAPSFEIVRVLGPGRFFIATRKHDGKAFKIPMERVSFWL
jgi:hypothetical protein